MFSPVISEVVCACALRSKNRLSIRKKGVDQYGGVNRSLVQPVLAFAFCSGEFQLYRICDRKIFTVNTRIKETAD